VSASSGCPRGESFSRGFDGLSARFDPKSQGREQKEPAKTATLDAREGRNRALMIVVRPSCSNDKPSAKFESWILLKSPALAAK